nr:MAG TPA: hypothetical protein [Caudoviricetes sp.]
MVSLYRRDYFSALIDFISETSPVSRPADIESVIRSDATETAARLVVGIATPDTELMFRSTFYASCLRIYVNVNNLII